MDSRSKESSEQIERLAATLILTAIRHGGLRAKARSGQKRVGEVNVIDPLQGSLKRNRSHVHKLPIFFMNREN
jgi:hypothetical protein